MNSWWDIGPEARAALKRPTAKEFLAQAKFCYTQQAVRWGEIAGLTDACYICPSRPASWRRIDDAFRAKMDQVDVDSERYPLAYVDRRMVEGDRAALIARMRTVRAVAHPSKDQNRRPPWLINPSAHPRIIEAALKTIEELRAEGINAAYDPAKHG